jgi:hypothetical protein
VHGGFGFDHDRAFVLLSLDDRLCRSLSLHFENLVFARNEVAELSVVTEHDASNPSGHALSGNIVERHVADSRERCHQLHDEVVIEGREIHDDL